METERLVHLTVRIPRPLRKLIRKYIEMDAHISESDFVRDALREKIQRDAPNLYQELFLTIGQEGADRAP